MFVNEIEKQGILEKIRTEEGCLGYDYFYPASGNDEILLIEKWESEELQQAHLKQTHMSVLKEIKDRYIVDTSVEKGYCTVPQSEKFSFDKKFEFRSV